MLSKIKGWLRGAIREVPQPISPCSHDFLEVEVSRGWRKSEDGHTVRWVKWANRCKFCGVFDKCLNG